MFLFRFKAIETRQFVKRTTQTVMEFPNEIDCLIILSHYFCITDRTFERGIYNIINGTRYNGVTHQSVLGCCHGFRCYSTLWVSNFVRYCRLGDSTVSRGKTKRIPRDQIISSDNPTGDNDFCFFIVPYKYIGGWTRTEAAVHVAAASFRIIIIIASSSGRAGRRNETERGRHKRRERL